jgi:hypothetical protein
MVNRVVARTKLNDSRDAAGLMQMLAAAGAGDEQNSIKIMSLLDLYSFDRAKGPDLDERAADVNAAIGGNLPPRIKGTRSQGKIELIRSVGTGVVPIPVGQRIERIGGSQKVVAVTTVAGEFADGSVSSGLISAVTEQKGSFTESEPNTFRKMITRVPGVVSANNPVPFIGGVDTEKDDDFRERIKGYIRGLALCPPRSIQALALQVELESGERVLTARPLERDDRPGRGILYIDNGTGTTAEGHIHDVVDEEVLNPATGGERMLQLQRFPIVESETLTIRVNGVIQVRDTDYFLMAGTGSFHLSEASFPDGLSDGDTVTATYSYYSGLVAETQWRIDGRADNPIDYPGWRAFGGFILVRPSEPLWVTIDAVLTIKTGYSRDAAVTKARSVVSRYINTRTDGEDPVRNRIIDEMMDVPGVGDLNLLAPAANISVPDTFVARVRTSGLLIR